jgi:Ala-tRNA(Pro) deacylase
MAVSPSVQEYLRQSNVAYSVFRHLPAYSAPEEAAVSHVPGRDWAKSVVCFADGEPIQAVVPADRQVDLERLAELARVAQIRLADEAELDWLYPE